MRNTGNDRIWEKLEWDSSFFGFDIASISVPFSAIELDDAWLEMQQNGIWFAYAFCAPGAGEERLLISKGARIPATRVDFRKDIVPSTEILQTPFHLLEFPQGAGYEPLVTLALQSGIYSRFRMDSKLPTNTFERMYTEWIKKAVAGEMADVILVVSDGNSPAGMITLSKKDSTVKIGLFAVLHIYRRQGLGSLLLSAAEQWGIKNGCTAIEVTGQMQNREACRFYESSGMEITLLQNALHVWI